MTLLAPRLDDLRSDNRAGVFCLGRTSRGQRAPARRPIAMSGFISVRFVRRLVSRSGSTLFVVMLPTAAGAQGSVSGGAREIWSLNFANAQAGQVPAGLRLSGSVDLVDKDGVRMLRAKGPAQFLVTLPEALPTDFTIEFDLVPKECGCGEKDLEFDGTAGTWSGSSARVEWSPADQRVSGGGPSPFTMTTPTLGETAPGQLTKIIASFEGNTLKLYTNGQRLYTLSDRVFARGGVLRVLLGGKDEEQAVYLARLRVTAGAASTVVATQSSLVTTTTSTSGGTVQAVGASPPAATITPLPAAPPPASAGAVNQGPVVTRQSSSRTGVLPETSLAPRTITLAGFTAAGGFGPLAPRTITLSGFTAAGGFASIAPRTVTLSGFTAAGLFSNLAPRTITLSGFAATGVSSLAARTFTLTGFTATGVSSLAARTFTLTGFTATGVSSLGPRTITLSGFTATGSFVTLAPRTISLSGWTAVGVIP